MIKKSHDRKFLSRGSSLQCESAVIHNRNSKAVNSIRYNHKLGEEYRFDHIRSFTLIHHGTIAYINPTRCDGNIECLNKEDERDCGFSTFEAILTGNNHFSL